jgi:hypothetical protein
MSGATNARSMGECAKMSHCRFSYRPEPAIGQVALVVGLSLRWPRRTNIHASIRVNCCQSFSALELGARDDSNDEVKDTGLSEVTIVWQSNTTFSRVWVNDLGVAEGNLEPIANR